jgi:hypothetical protein
MQDLAYAVKEKVVEDHNVIDEAIREEAEVSLMSNFCVRSRHLPYNRAIQYFPFQLVLCIDQTKPRFAI